jgi:hypothetical protein
MDFDRLGKCPTCEYAISLTALSCPQCGEADFVRYTWTEEVCRVCDGNGWFKSRECTDPLGDIMCQNCKSMGRRMTRYDARRPRPA